MCLMINGHVFSVTSISKRDKRSNMRYVLVTGANGGMGREAVKKMTSLGFTVFAMDRAAVDEGEGEIPIVADVTDEAALGNAFLKICGITDSLYAIIHFAGVYMLDSLVEMPSESFKRAFDINVTGVYLVNKIMFPLLKKDSRILITTSELATLDPLPFTGIYGVTKCALDRYAYSLCMELQLLGIHVSVLRAGAVDTNMLGASTDALDRFTDGTKIYSCNAKKFREIVDKVEARRISPSKLAELTASIIGKKSPRFAYSVNRNPLLLLLNMLPKKLQLFIIRKILK